jgi:hypothetical protein
MAEKITVDEWLAELEKIKSDDGPDGFAARDVRAALGVGEARASLLMRSWFERGLIRFVGKRRVQAMDGKSTTVPVYERVAKNGRVARRSKKRRP